MKNKKSPITLYETDYVFVDKNGNFGKFPDGQIAITADIEEKWEDGFNAVKCTSLSTEKQKELIDNIETFN